MPITLLDSRMRPVFRWLLTGCLLIFVMVVVGGITRLTHSGLSIVEWDPVMGAIPPLSEAQWEETFAKYQQTPEFQKVNYNMTLQEFKGIFFWEYLHRLIGRILGLVFFIPFLWFVYKGLVRNKLLFQSLVILSMGGLQGFVGWWMVSSGLVDNPDVSHYRLAAHLLMAFVTCAYIFWVATSLLKRKENKFNTPGLLLFTKAALSVLLIQIIYGAFVAGLDAGFVLNTWPLMGDYWIHPAVTGSDKGGMELLEGLAGVQFVHRNMAWLVFFAGIYIVYRLRKMKAPKDLIKTGNVLILVLSLQFLLGVLTLITGVPLWLGVLHQVGAFVLLLVWIYILRQLSIQRY
jgi:cytochrome c oxidase assembly protein subunit 15